MCVRSLGNFIIKSFTEKLLKCSNFDEEARAFEAFNESLVAWTWEILVSRPRHLLSLFPTHRGAALRDEQAFYFRIVPKSWIFIWHHVRPSIPAVLRVWEGCQLNLRLNWRLIEEKRTPRRKSFMFSFFFIHLLMTSPSCSVYNNMDFWPLISFWD